MGGCCEVTCSELVAYAGAAAAPIGTVRRSPARGIASICGEDDILIKNRQESVR